LSESKLLERNTMDKKLVAKELTRVARILLSGGFGRFSPDLSDVLEAIIVKNKSKSEDEIVKIVKKDYGIRSDMKDEGMTDDNLRDIIKDVLKFA